MTAPPTDARAFFLVERARAQETRRRWRRSRGTRSSDLGRENLVRDPDHGPPRGTREHVGALFEASATAQELGSTSPPR